MSETSELDKMLAVQADSQIIGEFLEWAQYNGYHFTKTQTVKAEGHHLFTNKSYEYDRDIEVPVGIEEALAHYYEIDLDKARAEQDAVYARLREASACRRGAEKKEKTGEDPAP